MAQRTLAIVLIAATVKYASRFAGQTGRFPGRMAARGDLYVVAQITIPKELSDADRALWEQLAKSG